MKPDEKSELALLPEEEHETHATTAGAAAAGAVTGGVVGLVGGPIGAAIGAVGGAIIGVAAERIMHGEDDSGDPASWVEPEILEETEEPLGRTTRGCQTTAS